MNTSLHDLVAPYALDALEPGERARFERHLAGCAQCEAELAPLQDAAAALAYPTASVEPPPELRGRILAGLHGETRGNVVSLPGRRWTASAAAALAAVAAAGAVGLGLWGLSESRSLDRERSARRAQEPALAVVADPRAVHYPLLGARGSVAVAPSGRAALLVEQLERAPRQQTYELWVVAGGKPLPAGLFRGGGGRTLVALTRPVPRGAQVAVSLEPEGGVETLTGTLLFGAQIA